MQLENLRAGQVCPLLLMQQTLPRFFAWLRPMLVCMALFAVANGAVASAGTQTDMVDVSAVVPGACSVNSTTPPVIDYDPVSANATTDLRYLLGTITLICSGSRTAIINPDHGLHGAASGAYFQNRLYQYPSGQYLNYSIYQDSAYAQIFGTTSTNGSASGSSESVTVASGSSQAVNVYMDIPAGQNQAIGVYTDQIDFTVTY